MGTFVTKEKSNIIGDDQIDHPPYFQRTTPFNGHRAAM